MGLQMRHLFGSDGEIHIKMLNKTCEILKNVKYAFADPNSLKEILLKDIALGQQLLWFDVLQQCHFISCASLLRTKRWIDGIEYGLTERNYIIFASSLRGLIESTADSYDAMQYIGITLAENFTPITLTLNGELMKTSDGKVVYFNSEPFDIVIEHFINAKKMNDSELKRRTRNMNAELVNRFKEVNQAKEPWKYIEILNKQGFGNLSPIYKELCEVTHPAGESVNLFLNKNPDNTFNLNIFNDEESIQLFIKKYSKKIKKLLVPSINPSLIALSTLDEFPINNLVFASLFPSELKTREIAQSMNLTEIHAWIKIKTKIEQQKLLLIK